VLIGNIDEKRELLVVVDMIRGFIEQGPLSDPAISTIIIDIVELIKDFTSRGQTVIAFRDAHSTDSLEFANYPLHCQKGSVESEFVDAIGKYEKQMLVIDKDTTNGFHTPAFQSFIKSEAPFERIVISGCCTDICILQFALTLKTYLQTMKVATEVIVVQDAVETFEMPGHPRKEINEFAYMLLRNAGILTPAHWEKNES
jgi:nicotinamidase-related amidase